MNKKSYIAPCSACGSLMKREIGGSVACSEKCMEEIKRKAREPVFRAAEPPPGLSQKARRRWYKKQHARMRVIHQRRFELTPKKEKVERKAVALQKKFGTTFYTSREWLGLRYEAIRRSRGSCEACGQSKADGVKLHVDHIKPRSRFPGLELELSNLQVLCEQCNLGKGNRDEMDWRVV